MSEGELKKRIDLLAEPPTSPSYIFGPELRKLKMSDILQIVDEARKEFPCYGCDLRCVYCGHECYEFKEWFLKWLDNK